MTPADCPDLPTLEQFLAGELAEPQATELESHLSGCEQCAALLSSATGDDTLIRAMRGQEVIAQSQNTQLNRLVERVLDHKQTNADHTEVEMSHRAAPPPTGAVLAGDALVRGIVSSRLVTAERLEAARAALPASADDNALMQALVTQGDVTAWQAEQLLRGNTVFFLDNDRYVIRSQIGQGGMGAVYRATHVTMNRDVALKIIDPRKVTDKSVVDRFKREVLVSAKLQHEHIVQAHDMGVHGGVSFLVLEFVEGADLSAIVKRDGPMDPAEAAAICLQAASGLAYSHAQGIVHRDIKPQNILLSTKGVAKILDMGLARMTDEAADDHTALTQEGTVMGTIDYMPPEQGIDTHAADERADIYSLGSTLYYLLAGHPPFPKGTALEKLRRLATEEPQPLGQIRPDLPVELTSIVTRAMAKRPEDRFPTMEDMVRALQPLAAESIAGRSVATASVLTAANTHREGSSARTLETSPAFMISDEDSVQSSVRRRQRSGSGTWIIGATVAAALLIGVGLWAAMSGRGGKPNGHGKKPSKAKVAKVSPDLHNPPSQVRIIPRIGHFGEVRYAAWSPDGRYFVTSAEDGEIRVWDASSLKTTAVYTGHRTVPAGVIWLRDGKSVASWDKSRELHVWDAFTGKKQYTLDQPVLGSVTASADGSEIAFRGESGLVRWNIERNTPIQLVTDRVYSMLRYSPPGGTLQGQTFSDQGIIGSTFGTWRPRSRTGHPPGCRFAGSSELPICMISFSSMKHASQ